MEKRDKKTIPLLDMRKTLRNNNMSERDMIPTHRHSKAIYVNSLDFSVPLRSSRFGLNSEVFKLEIEKQNLYDSYNESGYATSENFTHDSIPYTDWSHSQEILLNQCAIKLSSCVPVSSLLNDLNTPDTDSPRIFTPIKNEVEKNPRSSLYQNLKREIASTIISTQCEHLKKVESQELVIEEEFKSLEPVNNSTDVCESTASDSNPICSEISVETLELTSRQSPNEISPPSSLQNSSTPSNLSCLENETHLVNHILSLNNASNIIRERFSMRYNWIFYKKKEFDIINTCSIAEVKKYRSEIKKKIILGLNQLASTDSQINHVTSILLKVLKESEPKEVMIHNFTIALLLNCLLTNQQIQIQNNPASVWSSAMLIKKLSSYSNFRFYFESALLAECIYLIPFYINEATLDTKQLLQMINQEDEETEYEYFQRMGVFFRYWLAVIVSMNDKHLYWIWLAHFLNTPPQRISGCILSIFLQVSGFFGLKMYPKQFPKIIYYIDDFFYPELLALQKEDRTGVLKPYCVQIQTILEEFKNKQCFATPKGYIIKNKEESIYACI